jgi:DNA-binding SARP family transcriptional activator
MLGGFRLHDTAGQDIRIASRKGRALLAYLAMRPDEAHARDRLALLLWEEADEELARTSLRQALAALRKSIPTSTAGLLRAGSDTLALDSAYLDTDLQSLRNALDAQNRTTLQSGLAHYRGDLLEGFDARSSAFDEWLSAERQTLRRQVTEALQRLGALCSAQQDDEGALAACIRLIALEPLNEAAHRNLMQLHARRGSFAEALRQYRVCRDALRRELDVAPEPATEALYRDLMRRRRAATEASTDPAEEFAGDDASLRAAQVASSRPTEKRAGLRDAVVMVARFDGLLELEASVDPEAMHRVSTSLQRLVHQAVQEFGGIADRRVGANVTAAFGVPNAYGNEAERAARAALLLRDFMAATPLPEGSDISLRIGMAQGQVINGIELFPLTGRPMHIAHALAARACDREILLSDELRQSLGERVTVQRTTLPADASRDTSSAWALSSLQTDAARSKRAFVGRRPELAMILASLDRCASSRHGRAIVLRGAAGIGKTRLADAICSAAAERGVATHCAQLFDFGQSPGRRPITLLALSLLELSPDASAAERTAAVRDTAKNSGFDQSIFLSDLIDAPLHGDLAALEKAMDAATRQRGRAQALGRLIEAASQRRALLLLVEDVHWADNEELARLGEIAAVVANCPVLLLMTTRPEGDPTGAAWRARARGCPVTTIDLAPLAEDEALELAADYPELSPATIEACIRRAEGYPLFLDQLLRAASSGYDTLPGSVRTLVVSRADTLAPSDHDALNAAAVLGHRFQLAALRALIGADDYEPDRLIDAALLRSEGTDLQFAHALFRDAIYESALKSRRRDLHLRAAEWFRGRDAALHADHLSAADDEQAVAAYLAAARAEQQALRFERALTLTNKSYALAREPLMLYEVSCLLGELQVQLGKTHDGLASYREALDFALDQTGKGLALLGIASALRIMDRHDEALAALDGAESALAMHDDLRVKARLCTLRGNLCFPLGRVDACLEAHQRALEYAQAAHSPADIARAYGGIGDAWYQRGRMLTARDRFAQCIAEARRHALAEVLIANLPMLAITHTYSGDALAGEQYFQEALELVRQIGDVRGELLIHLGVAGGLLTQGRIEDCRVRARRSLDLAKQLGARRFQAESLGILAATMMIDGPNEAALQLVQEALQIARETGMTYCGPTLLSLAARASADDAQCTALLAEGETLLAQGCVSHSYFEFYGNAIEVSLRKKRPDETRRYATALERYTAGEPSPWTALIIKRARVLADTMENPSKPGVAAALGAVRSECLRMHVHSLLPPIEQASIGR